MFVLALELAAEGGRGFPVAERAASDANREGGPFLGHPLAEQPRRQLLFARSLLSAAALVGALLLRPRPRQLAPAGSDRAFPGGGVSGAGAGGSLERGAQS